MVMVSGSPPVGEENRRPETFERKENEPKSDRFRLEVISNKPVGSLSSSENERLDEWLELRTAYVLKEGWLTPEDLVHQNGSVVDKDKYDGSGPITYNTLMTNSEGDLLTGARFTLPESPEELLSRDMFERSPETQEEIDRALRDIDAETLVKEGRLWDMTRLTVNPEANVKDQLQGMMRIFGAGVPLTESEKGPSSWIFTTTSNVLKLLGRNGIGPINVIASTDLENHAGQTEETMICMLNAQEAFSSVMERAFEDDMKGKGTDTSGAKQVAEGYGMGLHTLNM